MALVHVVIGLALLEFFVFGALVGRARGQYKVEAPATTGHPVFERYFRVHYNTLEQLIVFIPGMLLFGTYVSPLWASILGAVFIAGRIVYLRGYVDEPRRRSTGFGLTMLPSAVLLIGGTGGAAWQLLR